MNRHAKAPSAGSALGSAGARNPLALLGLVSAFALIFAMALSGQASASQFYKFKEAFGSAGHPTFTQATGLAVDQSSGDLLVMDKGNGTISRFKPDGTPDNFSALGTNVIDGASGEDKTPQEGLSFSSPSEAQIAMDNSGTITNGDIYVTAEPNLIDIFASSGAYLGQLTGFQEACGVAVDAGGDVYVGDYIAGLKKFSPTANPPVNADLVATFHEPSSPCTLAAGAGPTAGSLFPATYNGSLFKQDPATGQIDYTAFEGSVTTMTVAPGSGHVFAAHGQEVQELDASGSSSATSLARVKAQGSVVGVAVDSSGNVYISRSGSSEIEVFATTVNLPTVTATNATSVTGTKATLNGTVNPEGEAITECFFEYGTDQSYGQTAPCETLPPPDSSTHPVSARISGLASDGATVHYRLVAANANGSEVSEDHTLVTASTTVVEPATSIGVGTATLNGTVRPEGIPYTACKFEYGSNTSAGFEDEAPCNPSAGDITADFAAHAVSAAITGLEGGTTYKFRLTVTNAKGTLTSEEVTFTTFGPPVIAEVRALNASQSAATIEGRINPSGFATSYRFEWGPTTSYGNQIPAELEPFIGEGSKPLRVSAKLSGLSAGTTYHYRLVASSSAGTTATPDQVLETLNSCGLPEERCFELVSRRAAGPVAIAGLGESSRGGPGELLYGVEIGYPDATKGALSDWLAKRTPSGWGPSIQFSPPVTGPEEQLGNGSASNYTQWVSDDLSCAVQESASELTADPGSRMTIEDGATNLYRRNPDGSYTAITSLPITNAAELKSYAEAGAALQFVPLIATQDCSKVVFSTPYHYPGVPGKSEFTSSLRLYEWEEGALRNVGVVPGPSGEVAVQATLGGPTISSRTNTANAFSADGSRVFFSATRETSPNPEEIGNLAVFAREDGERTIDVSLSETATPDTGATYMEATPDGSRVFFTANAGLTDEGSVEGTDLYEYDFEKPEGERLTDLSVSTKAGGAQVTGMLGASEDGSRVYFAARGQLLPGRGNTYAENQSADTYSVYGESGGSFDFVGTATAEDLGDDMVNGRNNWRAKVSPDGRFLLFESSATVTGHEGSGVIEAYLYDTAATSEPVVCVSCRSDGKPSLPPIDHLLREIGPNLVVREGKPQVFFYSANPLAPGAQEGRVNLYEWSHGQVFRLASQIGGGERAQLIGASEDGSDLYFSTTETLNWEDGDARSSVYDARIGGGFPEPPPAPGPCDATAEGSCQGPAQGGTAVPGAASASFNGPGNPQTQSQKKKSQKKKKKSKKHSKKKGSGKKARHANGERRAGK